MTKKIAFLFPGQGSQSVGMLDSFKSNPSTASLFATAAQEAEQALGQNLADLIEQGPSESLNLTTNTQPAMLMADVLVMRAWLAAGGAMPNLLAGHSLGEYAALVASGVFSLSEGWGLVRIRAQAMQEAVPVGQGGMAAIIAGSLQPEPGRQRPAHANHAWPGTEVACAALRCATSAAASCGVVTTIDLAVGSS